MAAKTTAEAIDLPASGLSDGLVDLRPWSDADAADLHNAWNDDEIARWTAVPESISLDVARRWIAGDGERLRAGLAADLVIWSSGDSDLVGEVGLAPIDWGRRAAQVGYWVHREARGMGFASAALELMTRWATTDLGLRTCVARCLPDNAASVAVARACGYRPVRTDGSGYELLVYRTPG